MTETPARRVKRERSASESLLSITLILEAFLVFFTALTAFALREVTPAQALVGGILFVIALVVCGRLVRYPSGRVLGWILQLGVVALGFVLPLMFVIGAGFLALWAFCFMKGRSLDAAKAAYLTTHPKENPA